MAAAARQTGARGHRDHGGEGLGAAEGGAALARHAAVGGEAQVPGPRPGPHHHQPLRGHLPVDPAPGQAHHPGAGSAAVLGAVIAGKGPVTQAEAANNLPHLVRSALNSQGDH